jgi:hypothetical protein
MKTLARKENCRPAFLINIDAAIFINTSKWNSKSHKRIVSHY